MNIPFVEDRTEPHRKRLAGDGLLADCQRQIAAHRQEDRLVRTRLRIRRRRREIDRNIHGRKRSRDHEDDEQDQHHVDERRDVDLMNLGESVLALIEACAHGYSAALNVVDL